MQLSLIAWGLGTIITLLLTRLLEERVHAMIDRSTWDKRSSLLGRQIARFMLYIVHVRRDVVQVCTSWRLHEWAGVSDWALGLLESETRRQSQVDSARNTGTLLRAFVESVKASMEGFLDFILRCAIVRYLVPPVEHLLQLVMGVMGSKLRWHKFIVTVFALKWIHHVNHLARSERVTRGALWL